MSRRLLPEQTGYLRKPLDSVFATAGNLAVLRVIFQMTWGATGREVARRAGIRPQAAHDALSRLEGIGMVRRRPAGNAYLFELNREHFLVQRGLRPLLEAETGATRRLEQILTNALRGRAIWVGIFGSFARGEEQPRSDLDVCVIVPRASAKEKARALAHQAFDKLRKELGFLPAVVIFTLDEFRTGMALGAGAYPNIVKESMAVYGGDIMEVIGDPKNVPGKGRRS